MYGESGPQGRPATLELESWERFNARKGTFRIQLTENAHSEKLEWVPEMIWRQATVGTTTRLTGQVQFVLKLLDFWRLERRHAVGLPGFEQTEADHDRATKDTPNCALSAV